MDESFRERLADELAGLPEPPMGDLVLDALRQGKRLRLVRRAKIAGSALAAVVVLAIGVVLGGHAISGGHVSTASHPPTTPALTTTTAPTTTGIPQPAGPKAPTTLAAIAYRMQQLLPGAQLTNFAHVQSDVRLSLQFYVDRGSGPSMLVVNIYSKETLGACIQSGGGLTATCFAGPHGARTEVLGNPTNCVEATTVSVDHGDGVVVEVRVPDCLPWNGTTNPACPPALTSAEAMTIAADPSWGTSMDAQLVVAANAEHPSLATP